MELQQQDYVRYEDLPLETAQGRTLHVYLDQLNLGVLVVYGAQPNEFTQDIINLLVERADDLAFGIGNLRSKTERLEILKRLEHIAHYDDLTTLPNRILLADRLHQAMAMTKRRGERLTVVYLDLDGFKTINDTHGHEGGDHLLMTMATRMKEVIRWQRPEKGLLLPVVFLSVIEDHPLSAELGEWVIDSALTQMELWLDAGLNIPVSVNIGARQLQQANFVERLRFLLAAHPSINPGDLELEVVETSALEDLARVSSQVIDACRKIGVMFVLDDFGTGYSSLTYLKRLPVGLLKIDQSFVHNMLDDPDDLAILEGVLGLAVAFRRQVTAEGVETLKHGEMLLQLGCELAQGYSIARPMPAHELPGWSFVWRPHLSWSNRPSFPRGDLPLLFAGVEHLVWISAMGKHLKGEREAFAIGSPSVPLRYVVRRRGGWLSIMRNQFTKPLNRYASECMSWQRNFVNSRPRTRTRRCWQD